MERKRERFLPRRKNSAAARIIPSVELLSSGSCKVKKEREKKR
jgi:hypothetical protein